MDFKKFCLATRERGLVLYPDKQTQVENFRVSCMGVIDPHEMADAVQAMTGALLDIGIASAAPV